MNQAIIIQLKDKMNQNGFTAHSLEKKAGLKANAVHNILSGRSKNPSILIMRSIAKALNCTTSDLIDEDLNLSLDSKHNTQSDNVVSATIQNNELYIKCIQYFSSLLNKRSLWLDKRKFLKCTDEIYLYSFKKGVNNVDTHFAQWLLEKTEHQAPL